MSDEREPTCALWYWRSHAMDYELFAAEEEAARYAIYLDEYDGGSPVGVQFADGRTVLVEEWPAIDQARNAVRESGERPATPPAMRTIRDPFSSTDVQIEASEPDWLGR
jgi:hypothetical protein